MAKKKVDFNPGADGGLPVTRNEEGESGKRMGLSVVDDAGDDAAPEPTKHEKAHAQLTELGVFFKDKKEAELVNDHKIHPVHRGLVLEFLEKRDVKGKPLHFSDGNLEMIHLLHTRLRQEGKLK